MWCGQGCLCWLPGSWGHREVIQGGGGLFVGSLYLAPCVGLFARLDCVVALFSGHCSGAEELAQNRLVGPIMLYAAHSLVCNNLQDLPYKAPLMKHRVLGGARVPASASQLANLETDVGRGVVVMQQPVHLLT